MYAQQGLRIALLDARSDIRAHKSCALTTCNRAVPRSCNDSAPRKNCSPWEWWKPFRHSGPRGE
nr:hypothetical protein [Rhodococcus qingshengii]